MKQELYQPNLLSGIEHIYSFKPFYSNTTFNNSERVLIASVKDKVPIVMPIQLTLLSQVLIKTKNLFCLSIGNNAENNDFKELSIERIELELADSLVHVFTRPEQVSFFYRKNKKYKKKLMRIVSAEAVFFGCFSIIL